MTKSPRRPGPESTLAEVRAQLVQAATDELRRHGVELGLSQVRLSNAILAAGVARSTAYRSLADPNLAPQEVLHRDVLQKLLSRNARDANLSNVEIAVTEELERQQKNIASDSVHDRTNALRAIIRVGGGASYHSVAASIERSILTAAYGALQSSRPDDWRVEALAEGEISISKLFADLFLGMSDLFHYQLRPGYDILQFCTAAAALVEGMAMRHGLNDHLDNIRRPGDNEHSHRWTLYALSFEGIYTVFFEPNDTDDPFADLQRY